LSFTTPIFLLFLLVCSGLSRICPARWRASFLLAVSYAFYCTWSAPAAGILAVLTILAFRAALSVERARSHGRAGVAWLGLAAAVLLVCYLLAFKIALLLPSHGIAGLVMPLGISYYTFKLISYVLDVHWGKLPAETNLVNFAACVTFFPQIVAGPIQLPSDFLAQLPPKPSAAGSAWARIALGLIKKLLIADNLAPAVNFAYAHVSSLSGAPLWLALYLFPLQLYADFSGLTDIALGAGRLFGIAGPENFNRPFTASSITDYWRRWHMSLTTWLSEYLFVPLRMATREAGNCGLAASITVNMVAIGMWHGLTVGYLVFGMLHSVFLVADALTGRLRSRFFKSHPACTWLGGWLGWAVTFHAVALAMVFFRAPTASIAAALLGRIWSRPPISSLLAATFQPRNLHLLALGIAGYALLEAGERWRLDLPMARLRYSDIRWIRWSFYSATALLVAFGLALMLVSATTAPAPFIYAIF
jgi:D-alanyl-lipoteichoic acid acyltransferase DltB (MBOAT superfamily)